jgi:hypothetical protein
MYLVAKVQFFMFVFEAFKCAISCPSCDDTQIGTAYPQGDADISMTKWRHL